MEPLRENKEDKTDSQDKSPATPERCRTQKELTDTSPESRSQNKREHFTANDYGGSETVRHQPRHKGHIKILTSKQQAKKQENSRSKWIKSRIVTRPSDPRWTLFRS